MEETVSNPAAIISAGPLRAGACPQCHQPIQSNWYFCPNCGKDLQQKPRSTTALAQIGIYALSLFLPPLGLWPGIKYLREGAGNPKVRQIGTIAIGLTILSTIITVWLTIGFVQSYINTIYQSVGGLGGY